MDKQFRDTRRVYGAPMGRSNKGNIANCEIQSIQVFKINFLDDGYDDGGVYWGLPEDVYCARDGEAGEFFRTIRAKSLGEAVAKMDIPWEYLSNVPLTNPAPGAIAIRFSYHVTRIDDEGDICFEDHGFYRGGYRYSLCGENSDEILEEARSGRYDYTEGLPSAIVYAQSLGVYECSSSQITDGTEWWSSHGEIDDYASGDSIVYSMHIDGANLRLMQTIDRALKNNKTTQQKQWLI